MSTVDIFASVSLIEVRTGQLYSLYPAPITHKSIHIEGLEGVQLAKLGKDIAQDGSVDKRLSYNED